MVEYCEINGQKHEIFYEGFISHVKTVYIVPIGLKICPLCGKPLHAYTFAIPLVDTGFIHTNGRSCISCGAFFSVSPQFFKSLEHLRDQKNPKFSYKLDESFDVKYSLEHARQILDTCPSVYNQVTLVAKGAIKTYTIVTSKKDVSHENFVFHYSSPDALDLLTAIILKRNFVKLNNKRYLIAKIKYSDTNHQDTFRIISPSQPLFLESKSNGGYYSIKPHIIQVDGLLLFSKKPRLEIVPVSYNTITREYFVDPYVLRPLFKNHGYLINRVSFQSSFERREKSVLYSFGYNVSQSANLSAGERQQILAQIVEAGYLEIYEMINFLDFLINTNGKKRENVLACEKWKEDIVFLRNYKRDPKYAIFMAEIHHLFR